MDLEDLFIEMPQKFIVFNLSPETTDIKYPYSSLLHPSKNKDISIPFSETTLKDFNSANEELTKEELLFSSLSPELLKKLNCKKMKKYPRHIDFYNDFASTNFIDEQIVRNDFLTKWSKEVSPNDYRQMTIDGLLSKIKTNPTNQDFINIFLDEISTTIQTFFHETDKDKLINSIRNLKATITKNENNIKNFNFEILSAIEENLSILTDIISLRFKGDDLALYIKEVITILSVFKSKKILFKLLSFLQSHNDIPIDDTSSVVIDDIKDLANAINYKDCELVNIVFIESISYYINKYLVHPTIRNIKKIKDITFVVNNKTAFVLFTINDKVLYMKMNMENGSFITMGFVPIKAEQLKFLNLALKNDILYIYYVDNGKLNIKMFSFDNVNLIDTKVYLIEGSIINVFNDSNSAYVITKEKSLFTVKFKLCETSIKQYTIDSSNLSEFKMIDSLVISNHFYISDKYDNILVASFSFDNTSASLIYTETEHKTDNMTKLYLHKSTLYYMNYDHTSTNITFSKLTNNSQCSISCFEQKFHSVSADNLYQKLLMKYAKFLELYGNFDIKKIDLDSTLMGSPQLYALNINIKSIQFIINGVVSQCSDKLKYVYVYILNQITNCLFNLNKMRKQDDKEKYMLCDAEFKAVEQFIKKFVSEYTETKEKRRILYLIGSIIRNINANSDTAIVAVSDILPLMKTDISIKSKLCLLRILLQQKSTRNDFAVIQSICEIEKDIIMSGKYSEYYKEYSKISSITNEIFNTFCNSFDKSKLSQYYDIISANITSIAETIKDIDARKTILIKSLFTFRAMFLLIQFLISQVDKSFLSAHFNSLINVIISLNSIDIKENDVFDMDNIYEFESSHYLHNDKEHIEKITFDTQQTVMIKCDIKNSDVKWIEDKFSSFAIQNGTRSQFSISDVFNGIVYDITSLEFEFKKTKEDNDEYKYGIKYQIIPLKKDIDINSVDFTLNEGKLLLSLIEKSLIHYVTSISMKTAVDDIKNDDENDIDLSSIYANKLMQCITMPSADKDIIDIDEMISKISDQKVKSKLLVTYNQYKSEESQLISMKNYTDIDFTSEINKKVINKLNETLSKKNSYLSKLGGAQLQLPIVNIFKIVIKYFNMNSKFGLLVSDVDDDIVDTAVFETFLNIWTECSKVRTSLMATKSLIAEKNEKDIDIDAKMKEYIDSINSKANFIYDIIIPMTNIKFDLSIVDKIIKLLFDEKFNIEQIKSQSMTQNKKCLRIYNHLLIVNIILSSITKEDNINLILSEITSLYRKKSKLTSFSDDLTGADYINIDRVKNMFHFFLDVIESKIKSSASLRSTTQINLYQSLIWKIKGRDFNVLSNFMSMFSELLNEKEINKATRNPNKKIFGISVFNKGKVYDVLMNVFKVFVMQVLYKIKNVLKTDGDGDDIVNDDSTMMLKKATSKIFEADYMKIIDFLISFYSSLKATNRYHDELFVLLYRTLINEDELINLFKGRPQSEIFFEKIIDIAFHCETFTTKLLMLKFISLLIRKTNSSDDVYTAMMAVFSIKDKNCDCIFDSIVELLKKEKNHVIKSEYAKIIKSLSISEKKIATILNEENICDVIVHLVDVKLNPMSISSKISIRHSDAKKNESFSNGYIIAFAPPNAFSFTNEISLYQNENSKKIFYIKDIDSKAEDITINEAPINNVNVLNEFDSNDKFISTHAEKIIDVVIKYLKNNKNVFSMKTFIAMKILMKLIALATSSQAKEITKEIIPYITVDTRNMMFTSFEYIERKFINDYINDDYEDEMKIEVNDENITNIADFFTCKVNNNTFTIAYKKKKISFPITAVQKENEDNLLSCDSISFVNEIRSNSILLVDTITNDTLSLIETHKDKIQAVMFNKSDIDRYSIPIPLRWMSDKDIHKITTFMTEGFDNINETFSNAFMMQFSKEEEEEEINLCGLFNDEVPVEEVPQEKVKANSNVSNKEKAKEIIELLKEEHNNSFKRMIKQIAKRILFALLPQHKISYEDIDALNKDVNANLITLYRSLNLEYYFNMNDKSASNDELKKLLRNFLSSLLSEDKIDSSFISSFIEYYSSVPIEIAKPFYVMLNDLVVDKNAENVKLFSKVNTENEVLFGKVNNHYNIVYENILALLKTNVSFSSIAKEKFIEFIMNIFTYHKTITITNYANNSFISEFLLSFIDLVYDVITNKKSNYARYREIFSVNKLNSTIQAIIERIDVKEYLKGQSDVPLYKTQLMQFVFRYFDLGFFLMLKENNDELIEYWIQSNKEIFFLYLNYKALYVSKFINSETNIKEIMTLVAYDANVIDYFVTNDDVNELIREMNVNSITTSEREIKNEITLTKGSVNEIEIKTKINNTSVFKITHKNSNLNYKLATFSHDDKENKFYLQDIINTKEIANNCHFQTYQNGKKIVVVANENVNTQLFALGSNFSNALGIDGVIGKDYDTPQQCKGLSSSTWDFNYGYFYTVAHDEKANEVYSCGCNCGAGLKSRSIKSFTNKNRINDALKGKIDLIATGNCNASLILSNNEIFALGDKDTSIFKDITESKVKHPMKISQIPLNIELKEKIISLSINFKNAFAITSLGNGFAIGDNTQNQVSSSSVNVVYEWTMLPLPNKTKRFVKCSIGEKYMLFIIEDNNNKHRLYSIGDNTSFSCGLGEGVPKAKSVSLCKHCENLEFKEIYARNVASAAITTSGKLYLFGINPIEVNECPTLYDFNGDVIVDDVAICNTHMVVLVREKVDGVYRRKVYAGGNNEHAACGKNGKMHEIDFFSNNDEAVPIKIKVGYDRTYVMTVNAKEILNNKNDIEDTVSFIYDKEGDLLQKLKAFYRSDKCERFTNLYKSLNKNTLVSFLNLVEEEDDAVKKDDEVDFELFLKMIEREKYRNLRMVFSIDETNKVNKKESEGIFEVVKKKFKLINQLLLKFVKINERSVDKAFLQKAISDNLSFISSNMRIEQFKAELQKIKRCSSNNKRINIDRFKAHAFYDTKLPDKKFEKTIFAQFYNGIKTTSNTQFVLRVAAKLCTIDLKGEHATDQGGPYHEVFSNFCQELESESLDVFIKTPNNKNDVGLLKDKFMVNPSNKNDLYDNVYQFIGKLMASAISSGELLDLNIHPILWKFILGNEITFYDTETLDCLFYKMIKDLEKFVDNPAMESNFDSVFDLNFTFKNANNDEEELKPNGKEIKVTVANLKEFIELSKKAKINESAHQMEMIKEGFNSVINIKICQILTWRQLEEYVCGKHKIDIEFLKENTDYEGYDEKDQIVQWFWEWLSECDDDQKVLYLKFVWGKTRLPKKENLGASHRICSMTGGDSVFPHAATCFFMIKIPRYSSKKVLVDKLTYSIMNCTEIDGD